MASRAQIHAARQRALDKVANDSIARRESALERIRRQALSDEGISDVQAAQMQTAQLADRGWDADQQQSIERAVQELLRQSEPPPPQGFAFATPEERPYGQTMRPVEVAPASEDSVGPSPLKDPFASKREAQLSGLHPINVAASLAASPLAVTDVSEWVLDKLRGERSPSRFLQARRGINNFFGRTDASERMPNEFSMESDLAEMFPQLLAGAPRAVETATRNAGVGLPALRGQYIPAGENLRRYVPPALPAPERGALQLVQQDVPRLTVNPFQMDVEQLLKQINSTWDEINNAPRAIRRSHSPQDEMFRVTPGRYRPPQEGFTREQIRGDLESAIDDARVRRDTARLDALGGLQQYIEHDLGDVRHIPKDIVLKNLQTAYMNPRRTMSPQQQLDLFDFRKARPQMMQLSPHGALMPETPVVFAAGGAVKL